MPNPKPALFSADIASQALQDTLCAIAGGDTLALRTLYEATHQRLRAEARRWLSSAECADEAVQDTLVAVWRSAKRFDPSVARPMTWLLSIVRNQAIDRLRAGRTRNATLVPLEDEHSNTVPADLGLADDSRQHHERLALVQQGLPALAQEQRQAVALMLYRGLSQAEVAATCGVSETTARAWVKSGVQRLRSFAAARQGRGTHPGMSRTALPLSA
jgi:RNA polymerase sigma-70 factor, ECF subfamily